MTEQKVALVTGAGTGIGKAVVHNLLSAGYAVVLTGRNLESLQATVDSYTGDSSVIVDRTLCVSCDVGKPDPVKSLFRQTEEKFGRLDVLFNNAGSFTPAVPMEELSYEQWQGIVNVNLTGVFLCCQQAIRMMKQQNPQGGRIINNGSISSQTPRPFSAPYTSTKHAITGLTKSISLDGRPFRIACGQIDIGNAETPMTKKMPIGVPQANGEIAAEPVMDVQHVADAVLQMAELPLETNVLFMTIMATNMPFVGRG
ncbi:MAG: NAD(P)-dependent dehydrogenase (short-subunit alcohol dehydrogenase family) [Gammaproteobacteria bacterium]|jgi:NAD(P)-dependent dehydrogenase (short-subunit alcohol dehydrogenase family)